MDIKDKSGNIVNFKKQQSLKPNQHAITIYTEHGIIADGKVENFTTSPGNISSIYLKSGVTHVDIKFPSPLRKGEKFDRVLQFDFLDSYTQDTEFYDFFINYPLNEFFIQIFFPKERPCMKAIIYKVAGVAAIKLSELFIDNLQDGRTKICFHKKGGLKIGVSYKIEWDW